MTDVKGRIVLVTGAGAGIGRQLALEMAARGANLVLWDVDQPRLASVVDELGDGRGHTVRSYACDVGDADAVYATAEQVRADGGDPDVVVNSAGVASGARLLDIPDEKIRRTFEVNALALFWVAKAFLPAMVARDRGHMVTVATAAGLVGVARQAGYSASKHAAVGFDESLRVELSQIAPAVVTTVVCPYDVGGAPFEGVRTRIPFLLPVLRPGDVARKIADAIERDRRLVVLPPLLRLLPLLRALPPPAFDRVMDLFGVNVSMPHVVGHGRAS